MFDALCVILCTLSSPVSVSIKSSIIDTPLSGTSIVSFDYFSFTFGK